jgi:8-oxo-dGTP pyrophosphatase MutT (NUDIX family)
MNLDFAKLRERLALPLPGAAAHDIMRATPVGPVTPDFTHKSPARPGAVLILLYEQHGRIKFPLIKRQEYLGAHSGQVSLPGGKAERNETPVETALREGQEEIGIDPASMNIIGTLSDFFVIPSNFLVKPVIASSPQVPDFKPDPREVSRILIGDLKELMREDAIHNKEILAAGKFRMQAPHFDIEGEVVWGATAMILNELCHVLREVMDQHK